MPKHAARSDSNQQDIIDALRAAGASVFDTSRVGGGFPDLVVGFGGGIGITARTYLMEVKTVNGKLNKKQVKFHNEWRGQVDIVRSAEDALKVIGRL